jgi:hypothetical protein
MRSLWRRSYCEAGHVVFEYASNSMYKAECIMYKQHLTAMCKRSEGAHVLRDM